ncbi:MULTISPECIES: OsmC family protein [Vibrio]|jgi:putative redox protein|uniref:Osmotically inducible protein OsmC n=1 Tax=Vibrio mediterranei TaxID=689 RepID=A0ABX5D8C0_9VIBR|nr:MULTISPECIES: OsmC family protein [Vibrio]KFA97873.1 osmotically inducible protein OsmC [Vibrio sp. ER1A]MCG9627416.1 OsmC family protein [Vibrio mediterranei]MCG9658970.1 OsmC family protein [Vibrio mediterranei]MCG9662634.1 OsmC family protein [Vibrio mediterranei]PCD86083.1 osmotically inducible protein OsmC [Vibrio mediterranei]
MQAEVKWIEGFKFLGQSQSGHSIVMDGSGGETAPSPMEMVLMAAGGCSSVDVVDGLKSENQAVTSVNAKLTTERREIAPRIFTAINIHFEVSGDNLDEALVAKVTKDSLEKYCSVCLMLGAGVEMTHSWEII